jgi:hypothetical protein
MYVVACATPLVRTSSMASWRTFDHTTGMA